MGSPPAITGGPLDPHRRPWLAYAVALVYTGNPWADIGGSLVDMGSHLAYVGGPMVYIAGLLADVGRALAETRGPLAYTGGHLADVGRDVARRMQQVPMHPRGSAGPPRTSYAPMRRCRIANFLGIHTRPPAAN